MDIPTLDIEQDPKFNLRFRITVSEAILGTFHVDEIGMVHHFERAIFAIKRRLGSVASAFVASSEVGEWVIKHGGRTQVRQITYKRAGCTHYRAGWSVTFKERDKAMLFKLTWLNRPEALAA